MTRYITRQDFEKACDALWTEIQYQDALDRRTADEAKDPPGFATLGRRYLRKLEDDWADNPGTANLNVHEPPYVVEAALHDLRKLSAIFLRGMVYCGVRNRMGPLG